MGQYDDGASDSEGYEDYESVPQSVEVASSCGVMGPNDLEVLMAKQPLGRGSRRGGCRCYRCYSYIAIAI